MADTTDLELGTDTLNAAVDAIVDKVDDGGTAGKLKIYTSGDDLLAELTFSDPAFGASTAGVATANAITKDDSANASGVADYFEAEDSDSNMIFKGDCGEAGDGAAATLNTINIVTGIDVECSALTVTLPNT